MPHIGAGVYSRTELYTALIGWCLERFGDNLIVARLPSVLAGSLLVIAVFLWINAVAGRTAAWIGGLFVLLAPMSIELSQFARFYALHALTFWLGAIGVYALGTGAVTGAGRIVALGLGTALCLVSAWYLQILTVMGAVGLAMWLAVALVLPLSASLSARRWWSVSGTFALVAALAAAALSTTEIGNALLSKYQEIPLHAAHHRGQFWFYHLHLIERYPTLWPIFPFLAVIALAVRPRPTIFALCVFGTVFAALSFGGQKSLRYLFFALPFLFVVWAIALASLWPALREVVMGAIDRVAGSCAARFRQPLRWCLIAGSILFLVFSNGAPARVILTPLGIRVEGGYSADWPDAAAHLAPWVRDAEVVLTSHELHLLYYLGRADIVVSKERLAELDDGTEFWIDGRTGLPVVSTPESVELILACHANGVIVTDTLDKGWRSPTVIDDATADVIAGRTTPIELPDRLRIKAFHWQNPTDWRPPSGCDVISGVGADDPAG